MPNILIPWQPEQPLTERLRFLTNIIDSKDGSEQRVNARKAPRQEFDLTLRLTDEQRQVMENILLGGFPQTFDIPVWSDALVLSQDAAATDTSVKVYNSVPADLGWTPAYTDFRVGGKAFIWSDEDTYELVDTVSLDLMGAPDTVSFATALSRNYAAGAFIYPVRPAMLSKDISISRYPVRLTDYSPTFQVTDNNISIGNIDVFPQLNSKPILSDPNSMTSATFSESYSNNIFVNDGNTGVFSSVSFWLRSRRGSSKTFAITTKQRLWEVRQFLHWARGRQHSFYLPTFAPEFTADANLVSAATTVDIVRVGYTAYVNAATPRNIIRVALVDGTVYTKSITASVIVDANTERLTVDTGWAANVNKANISRIDILEKVRIDSDDITLTHKTGIGEAEVSFPVKAVLE